MKKEYMNPEMTVCMVGMQAYMDVNSLQIQDKDKGTVNGSDALSKERDDEAGDSWTDGLW